MHFSDVDPGSVQCSDDSEVSDSVPARPENESDWVSEQVETMARAWASGQRPSADEVLRSHPGLDTEHAIRLVYEEVCLRREAGEDVGSSEVLRRFPQWKSELEILLSCDRLLRPFVGQAKLPEVGERLGPYHLLAELGRGASGRTYLATEPALANRLVSLKVIADDQEEHLSLARLQHTHIIPLFSEQTFPDRGLRSLCMPYLGGTSLSRILDALEQIPLSNRHGKHILNELDRIESMRPSGLTATQGPYRRYLEQASYLQAICWVASCLAEGLQQAHAHGLVHMDVKPSNVLITADGMPMLLDFHLARRPVFAGEWISDRLGGTPGWMAPEQLTAIEAVGHGQPAPTAVDHRADLYSLGLLMCEALGGSGAISSASVWKTLRERNTGVTIGLADIVRKCLHARPEARYRNAAALADDLRRHLNDLPLRGVPNRSPLERIEKWRRRQIGANAWKFAAVIIPGLLAVVFYLYYAHHRQIFVELQDTLDDGRKLCREKRFSEAGRILARVLDREPESWFPGIAKFRLEIQEQMHTARRGLLAGDLHRLADLVRFRYGIINPRNEEAQVLLGRIGTIWKERANLLDPRGGELDLETERTIRTDLIELAIVWGELTVHLAAPDGTIEARNLAIRRLDEVERECGTSTALDRERRVHALALGQTDRRDIENPAPSTPWEHYELGRHHLRSAQLREARTEFLQALSLRPQDFWPNFYQGLCAYRLGLREEAVASFRTSIALAPGSGESYFNRALAYEAMGNVEEAYRDYTHALRCDPGLTPAAINRGILSYKQKRYVDAIESFLRALERTTERDTQGLIYFNLALVRRAQGDHSGALRDAEAAMVLGNLKARTICEELRRKFQ